MKSSYLRPVMKTFALATLCISSVATFAIDRYQFVPLPDLGHGGEALGMTISVNQDGTATIVGRVRDAQGNTHAGVWSWTQSFALTLLPGIGGDNSVAFACMDEEDFPFHAVGGAQTPGGVMKPVHWIENTGGTFTPFALPTPAGAAGTANSIRRCTFPFCGGYLVVGTVQGSSGISRATLWHQNADGTTDRTLTLGTLGGLSSEGVACPDDIVPAGSHGVRVIGSAQTPSGAWHACTWDVHDDGETWSSVISDRHPGGILSEFTGASAFNELGGFGCGVVNTSNGRTMGFFGTIGNMPSGAVLLTAPGFRNTSATGCAVTTYGNLIVGSAWDDPANPGAVAWNMIDDIGQTNAYPVAMVIDNAAQDVGTINLIRAVGPGIMAGSFLEGDIDRPLILLSDGTQLADVAQVLVGEDGNGIVTTNLWHSDGNMLRIRTRNADGDAASLQVSYYLGGAQDGSGTDNANIRARLVGNNATAQVDIQVYNFDTDMWDLIGTGFCDDMTIAEIVADFSGHANASTGEVRVRFDFTRLSGGMRGVLVDRAVVEIN